MSGTVKDATPTQLSLESMSGGDRSTFLPLTDGPITPCPSAPRLRAIPLPPLNTAPPTLNPLPSYMSHAPIEWDMLSPPSRTFVCHCCSHQNGDTSWFDEPAFIVKTRQTTTLQLQFHPPSTSLQFRVPGVPTLIVAFPCCSNSILRVGDVLDALHAQEQNVKNTRTQLSRMWDGLSLSSDENDALLLHIRYSPKYRGQLVYKSKL